MNFKSLFTLCFTILILCACKNESKSVAPVQTKAIEQEEVVSAKTFKNKAHEMVYNMVNKVGDYNMLKNKKDVVYTYTYKTPDGKADESTEKYIFEGELSYASYDKHDITLTDLKGQVEQGYDGQNYWLRHKGKSISDEKALKMTAFNRPTNFYWFAMFQKLLDPSVIYEYIGEKTIEGRIYDIVKISFDIPERPTDIYQLYINRETLLVDQFLFTVVDFNMVDTPLLMQLEYEEVEGMLIPAKRKYKMSTWNADIDDKPWVNLTWSNIKFDNGLSTEDFKL